MNRFVAMALSACLLFLAGIIFGNIQLDLLPGIVAHGWYHPSDMDWITAQILGTKPPSGFIPGADHSVWAALCGIYQKSASILGLSGLRLWTIVIPLIVELNLCLFLALTLRLGFTLGQGFGLTTVFLSTGATITWSVVPETHVIAPTSLLLVALLLSSRQLVPRLWTRPTPSRLGTFGVVIALAASITITNVMLPLLAAIPAMFVRKGRPILLLKETCRRVPTILTTGFVGIGLLALVHLAVFHLTNDPWMKQFLDILNERRIVRVMEGSWWESVLALAWFAPSISDYTGDPPHTLMQLKQTWPTLIAYFSGLLVLILTVCPLRIATARSIHIQAFALFGVVLHSVYGLCESFLFSANYTWASVIAIGLLGRSLFPRSIGWVLLAIAAPLFIANAVNWKRGVDWIIENDFILAPW